MSAPGSQSPTPLVPRLVLGGLVLLVLSWTAFMAHYLYRQAHRPRTGTEIVLPKNPGEPRKTAR